MQIWQLLTGVPEIENDRLRHIRLHERVNDLPDPNYATLKYFLGHLHKCVHPCRHLSPLINQLTPCCRIAEYEAENSMSIQNLAIVFGQTLFGQMIPGNGSFSNHANGGMADAPFQNKVIISLDDSWLSFFMLVIPYRRSRQF